MQQVQLSKHFALAGSVANAQALHKRPGTANILAFLKLWNADSLGPQNNNKKVRIANNKSGAPLKSNVRSAI